jgi:hypothetical protein
MCTRHAWRTAGNSVGTHHSLPRSVYRGEALPRSWSVKKTRGHHERVEAEGRWSWGWQAAKAPKVIDCESDGECPLYAFRAVESLGNHSIDRLDHGVNIKAARAWERYRHPKGLRDDLFHRERTR